MLARSTAPLRADLPVFQVSQSQDNKGLVQNQLVLVGIFSDGGWERGGKTHLLHHFIDLYVT